MGWMKDELLEVIGAEIGAASPITQREATGDKSVTLDTFEKSVLQTSYPDMDFPRKGGTTDSSSSKNFKFFVHAYNDLENFNLRTVSIVYPKRTGNEIRLYFNKASEFTIDTDTFNQKAVEDEPFWYVFKKAGEEFPHIGMADSKFLEEYATQHVDLLINEDIDDISYQAALQNELGKKRVLTSSAQFKRNMQESAQALVKANFSCEVDPTHVTFLSASSGKPFVEGHHLIPLSLQDEFEHSIDIKENIVALCPNCHRLLHHGINDDKEELLFKLWTERKELLKKKGIKVEIQTFLGFYLK
ncbi:HNH endonuclease [Sporosarcina sp. SAFN-010]|uniref:HNH endonuclease n=1 Tax=Sporosarcina sp. SAFN-010 TaxID=3387273 RepID=UPI003F80CBAD